MEMVNPLAAFREGWQTSQGIFDTRNQRLAGNALAAGDYQGGANALLQGGMLDEGMQVQAYDQKNRQAQAEQQRAAQEQARAVQAQHLKTLLQGAQSLRQLPPEARRQAYEAQVKPLLLQMGLGDDPQGQSMLARWEQSQFTDGELDPFITTLGGELQKPEWQFERAPDGSLTAYDQNNLANRQQLRGPDPYYAQEREAKIASMRAQEDQRRAAAAKARRPPVGRGGGKGKPAQGGSNQLPTGFVLE